MEPIVTKSQNTQGEVTRLYDTREKEGFWSRFVHPGLIVDVGYKGAFPENTPIFNEAEGLDIDTPGYNGKDLPYDTGSVSTIHASHLLEHIADYGYFLRECIRVLCVGGTVLLFVPLKEAYERRDVPPSKFNDDHKRFYTCASLLYEIETSLPRRSYKIEHLREQFAIDDLSLNPEFHALGPYEIECVIQKIS